MLNEPLTILHVEDDPDHAALVLRCLRDSQVANPIHLVTDGEAALDYLFRRGDYQDPRSSPRPQIVLLDLRLPRLDGLEVLRTIKTTETLLRIPVVILSTSESDEDIARSYEHHANSYLVKPFDFERLTEMMGSLGSFWLGWNHYPWPSKPSSAEAR